MNMTSILTTLLSSDSISGVSKSSKAKNSDVTSVLTAALPLLLNGAKEQAENKDTAPSFSQALASHGKKNTTNLAAFLDNVDMEDGSKIIGHLLGNNGDAIKDIAKQAGTTTKTAANVLSASAPLLMSLLGQKDNDDDDDNALGAIAAAVIKNVDVGSLVGNLLGAGTAKKKTATKKASSKKDDSTAELLGDLLGSLLK